MKNKVTLKACEEYVEQTKVYSLKDAISAIILYIILIAEYIFMGKIFVYKGADISEYFIFFVTAFFALLTVALVGLLCVVHKQKFDTVGFSKTHWIKSFKLGMFLFVIVIMGGLIRYLFFHGTVRSDIPRIFMRIIYFLFFIGFTEEVVFRGYIGTRLYGFFTSKGLSIVITGILFSLMHVPFQAMVAQVAPLEYIMINWSNLISISIMHIGFQWLYSKHNSIVAPTILHFIWDYVQWIFI